MHFSEVRFSRKDIITHCVPLNSKTSGCCHFRGRRTNSLCQIVLRRRDLREVGRQKLRRDGTGEGGRARIHRVATRIPVFSASKKEITRQKI